MSTSPQFLQYSSQPSAVRSVRTHWLYVLLAIAFICFTSTNLMSGSHTEVLVDATWRALFGSWHFNWTSSVNVLGRKIGHFFGYGMIGLLFRKAWYVSMRAYAIARGSRLGLLAASLGVFSTFTVAGFDEWHQTFLIHRHGCFGDVLTDTGGALFLVLLLWAIRSYRRRNALRVPATARIG